MKDFFISYTQADRDWAKWIAWALESAGFTCVIRAWDFQAGGNFVLDMHEATKDASRTVAVLSSDYFDSGFGKAEWAAAFAQDPTGEKGTLLPIRVRECEVDGLLRQIVYIDLVGKDQTAAEEALIAGVKRTRAKPSNAPRFPGDAAETPEHPGPAATVSPKISATDNETLASPSLVDRMLWRSVVNVPGAPTQNELLILMLDNHPRWMSKFYLRRSLRCRTQPLDDALTELVETGVLTRAIYVFFKLTSYGATLAREREARYRNMRCTE